MFDWCQTLHRVDVAAQQREPGSRRGQHEVVAFGRYVLGALLVVARRLVVSGVRRGEGSQEKRTGVAYARSHEVGFDGLFRPVGESEDPAPAAADLLDFEEHSDSVQTVVIRKGLDDRAVLGG